MKFFFGKQREIDTLLDNIHLLEKRNDEYLHLTINENQLSRTANSLLNSKLGERYFFGGGDANNVVDFGTFTFVGLKAVEDISAAAENVISKRLGASVVNLNCLSGIHAMMCAILSTTEPGDTIMSINPIHGGHAATKGIIERTGRKCIFADFNLVSMTIDEEKTAETFHKNHAVALYVDISCYIQPVNLLKIRESLGPTPLIIFDASHTLGLILGGEFMDPLRDGADIVCSNTHKTLAGPHRGLVVFKDKLLGEKSVDIMRQSLYSSIQTNQLLALAVTILEYDAYGATYAKKVIQNSQQLGLELSNLGYSVRKTDDGFYSKNEQVHLLLNSLGNYSDIYRRFVENHVSTNFLNCLGGEYFARLGTQEITRRGMVEKDMKTVANIIDKIIKGKNPKAEVITFTKKFKNIKYSFDK